ncbi:MAG: D-tyrosyl-tRNA(Tyr) deacylase [Lachnospiraceae bacterium]|nr:D-tyrosyl-tRNA(Tyr) deacylase [Lachnospiraceae bacterium]
MRFVVQVCSEASVEVEGKEVGAIGSGALVLVGIGREDTREIADRMVKKLLGLRIYPDEEGKTNLSLQAVGGSLLIVSQFTLYADCRKGNRPSFFKAGEPEEAERLYLYVAEKCRAAGFPVERGVFGAEMKIRLVNEGPFTVVLDSDELFGKKEEG